VTPQTPPSPIEPPAWTGVLESPPGAEVIIDGKRYLYFAGTAYLALQGHPDVIRAGAEAIQKYGVHTATSRGGYGTSPPVLEVERLAAEWFGTEAAYYFISGYWGNHLTLSALSGEFDIAFYDEQSHYCVVEALRLSGVPVVSFAHRSCDDLKDKLRSMVSAGERPLVITDGVFAASGRIAPVDAYIALLQDYAGSILALDDAHSAGVLGDGRGTFAYFGFSASHVNTLATTSGPRLFCSATCSKALGGSGGIIAGTQEWIARIMASSRIPNAASVPAAPVAGATAAALKLVASQPELRASLLDNARTLRHGLFTAGHPVEDSPVPFLGLVIGSANRMRTIQAMLRERGIIVAYFPTYSGVGSDGQLRIAVSAAHTQQMIHKLLSVLPPK
jgi:8-amino-7-oxononanoate synthase